MSDTATLEQPQPTLLDIGGKLINKNWVDESQPLLLPSQPLHYKAHRLQVLLDRLDKLAASNAGQLNSTTYLNVLNEYTKCCEAIKRGDTDVLGSEEVDSERTGRSKAPQVGDGERAGLDIGISADNPFAGQGTNPA